MKELTKDSTPTEIKEFLYRKGYKTVGQISKASNIPEKIIEGILGGEKEMKDFQLYKFKNLPDRIVNTQNSRKETRISECGARLNKILELTGHSIITLSKRIGVSKQTLYNIRTGLNIKTRSGKDYESVFTEEIAIKINRAYPSLNPDWIIKGEGPILIDEI